MTSSDDLRTTAPLRPSPAERARTVAERPVATVCAAGMEVGLALAHAITAEGTVLVVVRSSGELAAAVEGAPGRDLSTLVTVTDRAPVRLREPVRAALWLSGWATPVREEQVRAQLLAFADARPHHSLLDVGRGATLLRLDLAEVVLGEGGAVTEVSPEAFAGAAADPLAGEEAGYLAHLDADHPEVLQLLRARLGPAELGPDDDLRPLGMDRFGLRLRIERPTGHRDLRLAFTAPLTCAEQLGPAMAHLLACARVVRRGT